MNIERIATTKKNFNRASNTYDQEAYVHRQVAKYLYTHLNRPRLVNNILDIGSGTSILSEFITKNFSDEIIYNTDLSDEMLRVAQNKFKKSHFIHANMLELPFGEDFDIVLSSMSLQWLEDPEKIVEIVSKHLKTGASFAISVVMRGTFDRITRLRKLIVSESGTNLADNSSQAERLPTFEHLKSSFNSSKLTLNRSEKHLFKHHYKNVEDCFSAIKNLGIAGNSQRKLSQEEFKKLIQSYKNEISDFNLAPELDYQVGFFWGIKS